MVNAELENIPTCLDCMHLEKPCHIKTLLTQVGFFDENNVCKFFNKDSLEKSHLEASMIVYEPRETVYRRYTKIPFLNLIIRWIYKIQKQGE